MNKKEINKEKNYSYIQAVEENADAITKEEKLARAIGDVEEKYIEESKPKFSGKIKVFKIASCAACLALLIIGGVLIGNLMSKDKEEAGMAAKASQYENLDELLEHFGISKDDAPKDGHSDFYVTTKGYFEGGYESGVVTYEGNIYKILDNKVQIIRENDINGDIVGEIKGNANQIKRIDNKLIVADLDYYENGDYRENADSIYRVYDLSTADNPKLMNTYTFSANSSTYAIVGDELWFLSWEGACGCGHGNGYYESKMTTNGETIIWSDEEITILGDPTVIQYVAITKVKVETGEVVDKHAFYGEIEKIYWSEEWMVIDAYSGTQKGALYMYDMDDLTKPTSSLDLYNTAKDEGGCGGYRISSVLVEDNIIYAVGSSYKANDRSVEQVTALIWDTQKNKVLIENKEEGKEVDISDVIWDEKTALCTISGGSVLVEFKKDEINFTGYKEEASTEKKYYKNYPIDDELYVKTSEKYDSIAVYQYLFDGNAARACEVDVDIMGEKKVAKVLVIDENTLAVVVKMLEDTTDSSEMSYMTYELQVYKIVREGRMTLELVKSEVIGTAMTNVYASYKIYEKDGVKYLTSDITRGFIPIN